MGAEMQAEVIGQNVAVDEGLEGCDVRCGNGGVNLVLGGESLRDIGVQVAGQAGWVVVEGGGWERATGESDTDVNGRKGGLIIGEWASSDAATASAVRDGEVGSKGDRACVVDQAVAGHGGS